MRAQTDDAHDNDTADEEMVRRCCPLVHHAGATKTPSLDANDKDKMMNNRKKERYDHRS